MNYNEASKFFRALFKYEKAENVISESILSSLLGISDNQGSIYQGLGYQASIEKLFDFVIVDSKKLWNRINGFSFEILNLFYCFE